MGAEELNFRVRDGNGCFLLAITTTPPFMRDEQDKPAVSDSNPVVYGQASRPISIGQLNALPHLHLRPINLVVSEGPSVPHPL